MVSMRAFPSHNHCSWVQVSQQLRADSGMPKRLVVHYRRSVLADRGAQRQCSGSHVHPGDAVNVNP